MEVPDLSQIDDEEVLTLVLLDSTHPQVMNVMSKKDVSWLNSLFRFLPYV